VAAFAAVNNKAAVVGRLVARRSAERKAADNSAADNPVVEHSAADNSAVDNPVADSFVAEPLEGLGTGRPLESHSIDFSRSFPTPGPYPD